MKVPRQEFIDSGFMRIELTSYEKKWVHHNRYHLQITLDKQNLKIKKKYSEIKRFSEQIEKNLNIKNIALQPQLRTNDQYKSIQQLVKRLNSQFLDIKQESIQKDKNLKMEVRNYLYNMLFYNDQMNFSDDDSPDQKTQQSSTTLQNSILKSPTSNELKIDKGLKNKSMALAASLVSNVLKKVQIQPMKQIFKSINIVWLKRQHTWYECRLVISQTSLILHNLIQNLKIVIIFCKMNVDLIQQPYQRIQISQPLLKQNIELRLTNLLTNSEDRNEQNTGILTNKYLAFYSNIKSLVHKQRMIETYNFVKIKLIINKKPTVTTSFAGNSSLPNLMLAQNKKSKQFAIKIIHNTIISAFTVFSDFNCACQILVPIVSNYGVVQIFICQVKQTGVIPTFKQNLQNYSLPVQNIYDILYNQKPKRKTQIRSIPIENKAGSYILNFDYFQAGNMQTYYTCDKQNDKFEGNIQFDEPNRDEMRIQFNRLKRIMWTAEQYISNLKDLQNFVHPLQSYLYYTVLVLLILFFDMNYIVHYFLSFIAGLMLYNHPSFKSYIKQLFGYFNWYSDYKNLKNKLTSTTNIGSKEIVVGQCAMLNHLTAISYVPQNSQIRYSNILQNSQQYLVRFKKDNQKKKFLETFQLTVRKKRNIYKKYKRLQQILVKMNNLLMEIVNYIQKIKNLLAWYHHKKSYLFYLGVLITLFIITFIPIRFILLLIVYKMFSKGKNYYQTTRSYNQKILYQIYLLTIKQNKLQDPMLTYLKHDLKVINKKQSQYVTFEKKVKQNLQNILGIELDANTLKIFQIAKNIKQSIYLLSLCKKKYKIPLLTCRKYQINEKYSYKSSGLIQLVHIIVGFITLIPSDRNILGVRASTQNQMEEKQGNQNSQGFQQFDQFDDTNF